MDVSFAIIILSLMLLLITACVVLMLASVFAAIGEATRPQPPRKLNIVFNVSYPAQYKLEKLKEEVSAMLVETINKSQQRA